MRISDWSSDVCSSDIIIVEGGQICTKPPVGGRKLQPRFIGPDRFGVEGRKVDAKVETAALVTLGHGSVEQHVVARRELDAELRRESIVRRFRRPQIGRASCRERGCQYV